MELVSLAHDSGTDDGFASIPGTSPAMGPCPYPYGLRFNLTHEELGKLGYTDLPPAGTTLRIEAVGVVTKASSEDPDADGDVDYCCVEIQITELGLEEEGESEGEDTDEDSTQSDRAERMYGKSKQPA